MRGTRLSSYLENQVWPLFWVLSAANSIIVSRANGYEPGGDNDPDAYRKAMSSKTDLLLRRMSDRNRFHISEREERSIMPAAATEAMVAGKYLGFYRGIDLLKGPEDLFILFWHVRPHTVIELGSFTGASALWMTDALKGSNIECNVFSVDIDLSPPPTDQVPSATQLLRN